VTTIGPTMQGFGNAPHESIDVLLARMRAGDRQAGASFIGAYGERIRRRYRHKMGRAVRRLFDSQDLLATIGRRLDSFIQSGRLSAASEGELWAFVFRTADNVIIDRNRLASRLKEADFEDRRLAEVLESRLGRGLQQESGEWAYEIDRVLMAVPAGTDREMVSLWLAGNRHAVIAEHLGMTEAAVRKRWERLRETIREAVEHAP